MDADYKMLLHTQFFPTVDAMNFDYSGYRLPPPPYPGLHVTNMSAARDISRHLDQPRTTTGVHNMSGPGFTLRHSVANFLTAGAPAVMSSEARPVSGAVAVKPPSPTSTTTPIPGTASPSSDSGNSSLSSLSPSISPLYTSLYESRQPRDTLSLSPASLSPPPSQPGLSKPRDQTQSALLPSLPVPATNKADLSELREQAQTSLLSPLAVPATLAESNPQMLHQTYAQSHEKIPKTTVAEAAESKLCDQDTMAVANRRGERKRTRRVNFSAAQVSKLQDIFTNEPYPDSEKMEKIAKDLDMTEKQVKIWFQNKRARHRRRVATTSNNLASHVPQTPPMYFPMTAYGQPNPAAMTMTSSGQVSSATGFPSFHPASTMDIKAQPGQFGSDNTGTCRATGSLAWNPFWPMSTQHMFGAGQLPVSREQYPAAPSSSFVPRPTSWCVSPSYLRQGC